MKILVVSDTHGIDNRFYELYDALKDEVNMVIHCGDTQGSEEEMSRYLDCPFAAVMGNNDFFSGLPKDRTFEYGGKKFFVTHGHYYNVSLGYDRLIDEARSRSCDFAVFGHTHLPYYKEVNGLHVVNPGSLSYPRQHMRRPSFAIIEIASDGSVDVQLKVIEGGHFLDYSGKP